MNLLKKQGEIDRKMKEMEKNHVWKINEVEVLLDSRASKQYVDDTFNDLEAKLNRLFSDETSKLALSLTNLERKHDNDLGQFRDEIYNKLRSSDKTLNKVREDMTDKMSMETFEDSKKALEQKILQFSSRIRENKVRFDPLLNEMHEMRRLKEQFLDHEERYMEFQGTTQTKLSYILQEIEDLKNMPPPVVEQKIELPHIPQIDENDFEDMKFNVKQLRNENSHMNETILKLKDILADKVDNIIFDKNMEKKIDRDDVYLLMEKFSMEDDRIKKVQQDISSIIKRMDYIGDKMDKKIIRLKKELDLTSIQKLLKSKADDSEVKKEFENVDFKVKCMNDTMNGVKKDLDGMFGSLRKISDIISILQQEQATALASTKNAMCLSCGRGDANFLPPMQQVRGFDGNYYRSSGKDNRRAGNVKGVDAYQYGYEVFTQKQIVDDHDKIAHDPADKFYLGKNKRPRSSAVTKGKRNLPSIQESEKKQG